MQERNNSLLKFLDENLGPWILRVLGFVTFKKELPANVRQVALLKSAAIGDTILLSGVIYEIYQKYPEVKLYLVTGKSNRAIAQLFPWVQVVSLPMTKPWEALQILRQLDLDVIIDFDSWPRINAVLCFFSKATFRLGFRTLGQNRHYTYHEVQDHSSEVHEVENYFRIALRVFPLIELAQARVPRIPVLSQSPQSTRLGFNELQVVFHLCAGGKLAKQKSWPQENWLELAQKISQSVSSRKPVRFILTGVHQDKAQLQPVSMELQKLGRAQVETALDSSFSELVSRLSKVDLVVSVDTGIAHLAGAVGAKTVVLYGPTSPKRWGALGPHVTAICSDAAGAGQTSLGFDHAVSAKETMKAISVEQVLEAIGPELVKS